MKYRKRKPLAIVGNPNRLQAALAAFYERRPDLTINSWTKRSGLSEGTVRNFFTTINGNMEYTTLEKLATGAETTVDEMLGYRLRPQVPLIGKIGAGAKVTVFDGACDQGFDKDETVDAPDGIDDSTDLRALVIDGDSMLPFKPGWKVFFRQHHNGITENEIGKLCVVQCKNGKLLFKEVRRGQKPGRFNLESWNASPIEDVEIEWAAPFVAVTP